VTVDDALAWTSRLVSSGFLPGAVIGVADPAGPIATWAGGSIAGRDVTSDDVFPLFSVTKPIVALAALREVAGGALALDTPLADAVPEVTGRHPVPLRLHHLLEHTSGISEPPLDSPDGLDRSLRTAGSLFDAGTRVSYSSLAFHGVAELIAHATRRPAEDAVRAVVTDAGAPGLSFDPVGSPHTIPDIPEGGIDYDRFLALRHPGAGMFGRIGDLLALGSALLRDDGAVLAPAALARSLVSRTSRLPQSPAPPPGLEQRRALGWVTLHGEPGTPLEVAYGHSGWAGAEFWVLPHAGLAVALLTTKADAERNGLSRTELLDALVR